jgi:hypothetical protein
MRGCHSPRLAVGHVSWSGVSTKLTASRSANSSYARYAMAVASRFVRAGSVGGAARAACEPAAPVPRTARMRLGDALDADLELVVRAVAVEIGPELVCSAQSRQARVDDAQPVAGIRAVLVPGLDPPGVADGDRSVGMSPGDVADVRGSGDLPAVHLHIGLVDGLVLGDLWVDREDRDAVLGLGPAWVGAASAAGASAARGSPGSGTRQRGTPTPARSRPASQSPWG